MLRIRRVEERLVKEYLKADRRSFVHFYIGQEAIAVGVCMNLAKSDLVFSTHRSHGHYLAKGGDLKCMVAELFGKATGCSKGRGGSMHLIDKNVGFMGSISILSSVVPIATGAAFALKKQDKKNIAVVFLGDGASDEGAFYESVNLATLMKAPVLFIIENNLYAAMSDRKARHPDSYDMESIVRGLGGIYIKVNGNSFSDVYNTSANSIKNINHFECPVVLECMTYRHMAHSAPIMDDKLGYRKKDPLNVRLANCPIKRLENMIIDNGHANMGFFVEQDEQISAEINEAIKFGYESPYPKPEELTEGVYYE